jgi:hypothetical protein
MVTPNISLSRTERVMQAFSIIWQYRPELKGRYSETVAFGLGALVRSASSSVSASAFEPRAAPLVSKPVGALRTDAALDKLFELADEDW